MTFDWADWFTSHCSFMHLVILFNQTRSPLGNTQSLKITFTTIILMLLTLLTWKSYAEQGLWNCLVFVQSVSLSIHSIISFSRRTPLTLLNLPACVARQAGDINQIAFTACACHFVSWCRNLSTDLCICCLCFWWQRGTRDTVMYAVNHMYTVTLL